MLRRRGKRRFPTGANPAYLEWIRGFPCVVPHRCTGPVDPHHVRTRGAGGGDVGNVVPLCRSAHTELHAVGRHTFAQRYGVDLIVRARDVGERWVAQSAQQAPLKGVT